MTRTALAIVMALAGGPALACYTVYGEGNRVLYQGANPPVDMSQPLHQTLPAAYPGGHLVFAAGADCAAQPLVARSRVTPPGGGSPLLTDRATAAALGLPHTVLPNGIAMVRQRPDTMRPGVVVAESGLPAAVPDTSRMGAAPARPARPAPTLNERR